MTQHAHVTIGMCCYYICVAIGICVVITCVNVDGVLLVRMCQYKSIERVNVIHLRLFERNFSE